MPGLPQPLVELAARVSNRGRWGEYDQRGTLNLIDAAAVQRGVAAVRQGRPFSLAVPFDAEGPQSGAIPGRDNPALVMNMVAVPITGDPAGFTTSDDRMSMGVQAATHWDALSHVGYGGELYNGHPSSVVTEAGASKLGIEHFGPVVSRGILLDIARLRRARRSTGGTADAPRRAKRATRPRLARSRTSRPEHPALLLARPHRVPGRPGHQSPLPVARIVPSGVHRSSTRKGSTQWMHTRLAKKPVGSSPAFSMPSVSRERSI